MKKNKGITLVALVITIIILLILAGVAIVQLTDSGLFGKAKLAKEKGQDAQELENATLGDYESQMMKFIGGSTRLDDDWEIDSLTVSDFPYTVPENGFIQLFIVANSTKNAYFYIAGSSAGQICVTPYTSRRATTFGFVKKGDVLSISNRGEISSYTISYIH